MQFKSKLQLAAEKAAATNEQTTNADVPHTQPAPTPIPLLTLEDVAKSAKVQEPYNDLAQSEAEEPKEDAFISFDVPDYPKQLYDQAHIENEMRDFNVQLGNAMRPEIKSYTPPPVPPAIAEATRREMEAGRQRVAEFASVEQVRRAAIAARPKEPWEGATTQVFRPAAYVPDPKAPDRTGTLRTIQG